MLMSDYVSQNKKLLRDNAVEFQLTFGAPLHRFMHPLLGFDIVSFDEFIVTPDGMSTHDNLKQKFGEDALALIERLIA